MLLSELYRGHAGPALEGPVDSTLLREAGLKSNVGHTVFRVFEHVFSLFFLALPDQVAKGISVFCQPASEGPVAHAQVIGYLNYAGNTAWE